MARWLALAFVWLWSWGAQATVVPSCDVTMPAPGAADSAAMALQLVAMGGSTMPDDTVWQAPGGVISFTLKPQPDPSLPPPVVCFRVGGGRLIPAEHVSLLPTLTVGMATYAATLPRDLPSDPSVHRLARFVGVARLGEIAVVVPTKDNGLLVLTQPIGVTSLAVSGFLAVLSVVLTYLFMQRVARSLNVPGTWVLRIVSTGNGVASLSQLQVTLWTFVFGASAVYVMATSGGLLDVPDNMLALLGIAGVTTVGSKLQNAQQDSAAGGGPKASGAAAKPTGPPAAVTSVAEVGGRTTDTEITLAWVPSAALPPARSFRVEFKLSGADAWSMAESNALVPRCRVVGLEAGKRYVFRVTPLNEFGDGGAVTSGEIATCPAVPAPEQAPGQVIGLSVTQPPRRDGIGVVWAPVAGASAYVVRARAREVGSDWVDCGSTEQTGMVVSTGAVAHADRFEIQVAARGIGLATGPWSAILTGAPQRVPRWSDLVIKPGMSSEIDVTRVQMLFFTVIAALFVAIKVVATYAIPEIPQGFLLLMGISNGIYLTAKFIPD